jgi:hypothetical protein
MDIIFNQLYEFFFNSIKGFVLVQIIGILVIIKAIKIIGSMGKTQDSSSKNVLTKILPKDGLMFLINKERENKQKEKLENSWSLMKLAEKRAKTIAHDPDFLELVQFKPEAFKKLKINVFLSKNHTVENLSEIIVFNPDYKKTNNEDILNILMSNSNYKREILNKDCSTYGIGFCKNAVSIILSF